MTPLKQRIIAEIRARGPMPIERFMALALTDPDHGYYTTQLALGADGDFITAPEISQVFGELIGLWAADLWQRAGAPTAFRLIELGAGRGTLMADALRATARIPGFAPSVSLVEVSQRLRTEQAARVPQATWFDTVEAALADDARPAIVIANEFFDAMPIRQIISTDSGWQERCVGVDQERTALVWTTGPACEGPADDPVGTIREAAPQAKAIISAIAVHLASVGGALLILDYGPAQSGPGDTLQAVRAHRPLDPLAEPGLADLTAHVDFQVLAEAAAPLVVHGPTPQGSFLRQLGLDMRTDALARANPSQRAALYAASRRLSHPDAMGLLFKAMALRSAHWPTPAGFG
jgi:NADH dehydrogenase [ubiquinone] 1 alpha subcomplex assembly factor 7